MGTRGNVIDAIKASRLQADEIYACGPIPMLRGVKAFAMESGIPAQISLEEKMACGIGACLACVCQSKEMDSHSHVHNKGYVRTALYLTHGKLNCKGGVLSDRNVSVKWQK